MVNNTLDDNTTFWSPYYTVVENALAGFGIVDGCAISKGTADWDIDVTAGTVFISGTGRVAVSAGTVTITDSSGLASGNSRITLITADTSGTLASVDGSGAANPDAPDVPTDEVVLGFVVVTDTDSTAADSDIIDLPTLVESPVTDASATATKQDNTSGTEQTVQVDAAVTFDAAVLKASLNGASGDSSSYSTELTVTYNDATTQTFSASDTYNSGSAVSTSVGPTDLNEKYITSGIDKLDFDWNNEDDANDNTVDHEWYVKLVG